MIKGIYRKKDSKNWGLAILKAKNSPLECSIIEQHPTNLQVTHISESQFEMERSLLS